MVTPTVRTVNAQNQNHLVFAASNEAGWRRYLETLSRHTGCANAFYNLSAMNCAGLAASDWHESREILPIATWRSLFPGADIKAADGCRGVYGVKSRPRGSGGGLFYVDELFPPALLVGLPPTRLRGAARVLDPSVDIAGASWNDAKAGLYRLVNVADMDGDADAVPEAERVPVAWEDLDENTRFVIEAHFRAQGPGCASPVLPPDDVRAKASSLKRYVNEIVKAAAPLIRQMRNGYRAAFERHRRDVIPESDPSRESVRGAAESGDRPAPIETLPLEVSKDGAGLHVDVGELAREPIEKAMRAIGGHSRADGDGAGTETVVPPPMASVGDAGATGRHFARKDGTASPPGAGPQGGSLEVAHTGAEPCPATPPVPMRAAGAGDRSPDAKTGRGTARGQARARGAAREVLPPRQAAAGDGGTREERRRQDREGPRQEEETADGQGLVVRRSMQMAEKLEAGAVDGAEYYMVTVSESVSFSYPVLATDAEAAREKVDASARRSTSSGRRAAARASRPWTPWSPRT